MRKIETDMEIYIYIYKEIDRETIYRLNGYIMDISIYKHIYKNLLVSANYCFGIYDNI